MQPLEYVGELEYVLDTCTKEVEITALVEGGVPFVSPNGDSFYRYQWTLDLGNGQAVNYAGESIIVRETGNLNLTIYDSTGCQTSAASGTSITISEGISPYRILPRLASNTLFAEEPSCQNANRDDGKIQFEVVGGDLPQGGQYPYEIIWEKYKPENSQEDFINWTKSEAFRLAHKNAGQHKDLYLKPPEFEGFERVL